MTTQKKTVGTVLASAVVGLAIVAVVVGVAGLLGGTSWSQGALSGDDATSSQQEGQQAGCREVTDSRGRVVSVPEEPQAIAAFDAFSGNMCVLAGAGDRLTGVPGGVASNELLCQLCPGLESIQELSGNSINGETLLAAGVDVVFVRGSLYDDGEETQKLDELGIPYVVVDYDTVEAQIEAIELVGEVCGGQAGQKAAEIAQYYRQTVELVETRAATLSDADKKTVYHSINDPLLTDGSDSLGADWIARCGAVDVSAGEASTGSQGDYTATLEQVYVWNPDVVVCSTADAKESIEGDAQWVTLPAVAAGEVYNIPVSTSRWGQRGDPETFLGMLWLSKTLYPDLYEDIDLKDTVTSYYRDIIGLEIDDGLWAVILSGEGLRIQGSGSQGEE